MHGAVGSPNRRRVDQRHLARLQQLLQPLLLLFARSVRHLRLQIPDDFQRQVHRLRGLLGQELSELLSLVIRPHLIKVTDQQPAMVRQQKREQLTKVVAE